MLQRFTSPSVEGVVKTIAPKVRQLFQRVPPTPEGQEPDPDEERFIYFTKYLMPKLCVPVHTQFRTTA